MAPGNSKLFFAGLLLFVGLLFPNATWAATAVFFDQAAMTAGPTVESESGLRIRIPPKVFSDAAWVKVKPTTMPGRPPEGWEVSIGPMIVDVRIPQPRPLVRPIHLSFPIENASGPMQRVAFWDRNRAEWRLLDPRFDLVSGRIEGLLPFPYATVALLKNLGRTDAPMKIDDDVGPTLDSAAAIVIDNLTGATLFEKNPDRVAPIASLTKIMTAKIFLEHFPGWKKELAYQADDDRIGARLRVSPGETFTVKDAFYVTLVGSANNTAIALARSTGLSLEDFVTEMNLEAKELGLTQTQFIDPSGIEVGNISTAREFARLAAVAFKDFRLLQGTTTPAYSFITRNLKRPHKIKNTNKLIGSKLRITGAKTGYLDEALYCNLLKVKNDDGKEILVVVLGNPSSQDRFDESQQLVDWTFNHYEWNKPWN